MKVLVLTNENYKDFVVPIIWSNLGKNKVYLHMDGEFDFSLYSLTEYDVGISFMYTYKVPVKHVKSRSWINFHPGPLPMYRGRNLCYHAIMNDEKRFGATIHYMDETFDTGDIIEVLDFAIPEWATAEDLHGFTISASKQLFQLYFPRIITREQFDRKPNVNGEYYVKDKIPDVLETDPYLEKWVRAVTYKQFYPKINIHGVIYKIVRDE